MSVQKNLKKAIKRVPKDKEAIVSTFLQQEKIAHIKEVVRNIYPLLEKVDSIYDAQTSVNALSGFISAHIENQAAKIKLNELPIDLSKEEDSKIKEAILAIMELCKNEPAKELSSILERLGKTMGDYGAHEFLKNPMEQLSVDKILA